MPDEDRHAAETLERFRGYLHLLVRLRRQLASVGLDW